MKEVGLSTVAEDSEYSAVDEGRDNVRGLDRSIRPTAHPPLPTREAPGRFWNVPNSLTMSRLVLAIFVFGLITYEFYAWALAIFVIAAASDALDGYFARLLNQDTALGRQLDPLIDKVIVAGCYIYLATIPSTAVRPWMVAAIVVRELLIQGLRSHLEGQGQAFGARTAGKLKTVVQCASISAILLVLSLDASAPPALVQARDILTWLAVFLTLYSGFSYIWVAMPRLRGEA